MGDTKLATAEYFEQAEAARVAEEAAAMPGGLATNDPKLDRWANASRWISMGIAGALVVCIVALSIPYLTATRSGKRTSPIDWFLWFGGAKQDQTFERFVRNAAEANEREWDDKFRESPVYPFQGQPLNLNSGWQMQPAPAAHPKKK